VNWGFPVHYMSNLFELQPRKLHARPEEGKGRDRLSNNCFALDVSRDVFENESVIVRLPDVVENPPILLELEKYPALVISENVNRALVILSRRLDFGFGPIYGRKCGRAFIEVWVLRESKTFLVLEMAEAPKNV